ncbi:MAG: hypothetical protein ABIF10_04990 [Candidatus Woesearchaeota archaeon]
MFHRKKIVNTSHLDRDEEFYHEVDGIKDLVLFFSTRSVSSWPEFFAKIGPQIALLTYDYRKRELQEQDNKFLLTYLKAAIQGTPTKCISGYYGKCGSEKENRLIQTYLGLDAMLNNSRKFTEPNDEMLLCAVLTANQLFQYSKEHQTN